MAETPDGFLWLGTYGGLVRFDGVKFEVFDLANTPQLMTNRIVELTVDRHGALWAWALAGGLTRYADGRFTHFDLEFDDGLVEYHVLLEDEEGVLWAFADEAFRYQGDRFERVPGASLDPLWNDVPQVVFDRRTVEVTSLPGAPLPPAEFLQGLEGTVGDLVQSIHVDRNGQVWCGSQRAGLFRVRPPSSRRLEIGHPYQGCRFVPDGAGGVWIGPHRDLGLFHSLDGEIVDHVLGDPDAPIEWVLGMVAARDGTIWARHGQYVSALRGGEVEVRDLGYRGRGTSPMVEAADGAIWCGVDDRLCRITGDDVRWFGPQEGLDSTARISSLGATSDAAVWVGTLNTVFRWDGQQFARFDSEDGVPRGFVRAFCETSDGSFWVGSYGGGLGRLTGEGFVGYGAADGLLDNAISAILEDDHGYLWINGNHGAYCLRLEALLDHVPGESPELSIRSFRSGEGNGIGGCFAGNEVIFPTIHGLVAVDTARALVQHTAPPVARIEGSSLDRGRGFQIRYTAPDLLDPAGLRFQHRLVGYEDRWSRAGARREAFYTKLPPGEYTFEVVATDSSGQRGEPAVWRLSIPHRFYETKSFAILAGLLLAGLAFGAYRLRVRAVERHARDLSKEIVERRQVEKALLESRRVLRVLSRRLLSAQDEERRGIARELHDDVTQRLAALSIQAEVLERKMESSPEGDRQQARDLMHTARRLATDVQKLSRRLHPSSLAELGLVRAMRSECAAFAKREGIDVLFDAAEIPAELPSDLTLTAFRILQEGLHNAQKHARTSHIEVCLSTSNGDLDMTIVDQGRGFDPSDGAVSGGIGLVSMRERARSVGGHVKVDSKPGEGTAVHLRAPLWRTE
jgi:signal transduction histidine kinase